MAKSIAALAFLATFAVASSHAATTLRGALQPETSRAAAGSDIVRFLQGIDMRRAATPNDDGTVNCDTDADCVNPSIPNLVCEKNVKLCGCDKSKGYYFEPNGSFCNELPTSKAQCQWTCQKYSGKGAYCAAFKPTEFSCGCTFDGPGNYYVWDDPDNKVKCVELTFGRCDELCKEQFGEDASCDELDFSQCRI